MRTWTRLLDVLVRLYRRGEICPACAAIVAWEARKIDGAEPLSRGRNTVGVS